MNTESQTLRILTYNMHKGFGPLNLKFVLSQMKESIQNTNSELVLLQEVLGEHKRHASSIQEWPNESQFEFLADQMWPHYSYGRNAVYSDGHHGNAILSKYPITFFENEDISLSKIEKRGLLHVVVELPKLKTPLHVFNVHLGLFQKDRNQQVQKLAHRIRQLVPEHSPLILAGDFNDWREKTSQTLKNELGLQEAFLHHQGKHAASFPSLWPFLALDRIYFRNITCVSVEILSEGWTALSDHLPLIAEFKI